MNFKISKINNPRNSFIWRFDPRLKIISSILFFILIFLPTFEGGKSLTLYFLLTIIMISVFFIAKLPWKIFKIILKSSFLMIVFLFLFNILNFSEPASKENALTDKIFGFIQITKTGLIQMLYFTLRITLVILVSVILVSTTSTIQMTRAIESLLSPLKFLKFPVHILAMIITLSLRLVPTIMEESENIITAQASRGLDFRKGGWKTKIKSLISLLIPLIISILRKADEMTVAMESRGYNPDKERTYYFENQFKKLDWILFFIVVFMFGILVFFINYEIIIEFLEKNFLLEEWLSLKNKHSH